MAKFKLTIDTEDKSHDVKNDGGNLKKLTRQEYDQIVANAGSSNIENAVVIFTHKSPGCVTFYFRGVPYQV